MKDVTFERKCRADILTQELRDAGFQIYGVSTKNNVTTIHFYDEEKKNPTPIVDAHVYVAPLTDEELQLLNEQEKQAWKNTLATAKTTSKKLDVIAQFVGLKDVSAISKK